MADAYFINEPVAHMCRSEPDAKSDYGIVAEFQIASVINLMRLPVRGQYEPETGVRPDSEQGQAVWVPKMPSESFRPEFHQIDEFNFDPAFVNSDNSDSHSLGQTNLRKIRPSFRDGPFGLFRRINLIAPGRFLRLDLPSISIREHINHKHTVIPLKLMRYLTT